LTIAEIGRKTRAATNGRFRGTLAAARQDRLAERGAPGGFSARPRFFLGLGPAIFADGAVLLLASGLRDGSSILGVSFFFKVFSGRSRRADEEALRAHPQLLGSDLTRR